MSRYIKRASKKVGAAPGTLVHVGDRKLEKTRITLTAYNEGTASTTALYDVKDLSGITRTPGKQLWLNIDGVHDVALVEAIGKQFGIHPLTLEDVVSTRQRPKAEAFDAYLYIVLKMLQYNPETRVIKSEQISLIVFPDLLISFQESTGDVFEGVRERLGKEKSTIRKAACDYLAYALADAIVDQYFLILESLGQDLEALEDELINTPQAEAMQSIHGLRHELIFLRKQVWPLREVINRLAREESDIFQETTRLYIRDVYDHTIQIIDTIESYRDILSGFLDLYLSIVSYRMNEVMKTLTIIATIFIPITFIAGVYGMNFKNMPELDWRWGYAGVWALMLAAVAGMVSYCKRKKWW
jgi:magnesium transporter